MSLVFDIGFSRSGFPLDKFLPSCCEGGRPFSSRPPSFRPLFSPLALPFPPPPQPPTPLPVQAAVEIDAGAQN